MPIHSIPWIDVGSHRIYFLEINAIQLRQDIAEGRSQILWRSLPTWVLQFELQGSVPAEGSPSEWTLPERLHTAIAFPSTGTIAFEADTVERGMGVKYLPPLPEDQMEVDNDRATWLFFSASSAGMITTWAADGIANLMPCGSTTVVSRNPFVIAPCVSYGAINERYAPRATLDIMRRTDVRLRCAFHQLRGRRRPLDEICWQYFGRQRSREGGPFRT